MGICNKFHLPSDLPVGQHRIKALLGFLLALILAGGHFPVQAQFTDCASVTTIPETECDALVALYNSTDGPNWDVNADWLVGEDPCLWGAGLACSSGHVSFINLSGNNLSGPIPAELGNLGSLTFLSLGGNGLTGSIPTELGNLSSVQELLLGSNSLDGTIPTSLGGLASLQNLDLSGNNLTGSIPSQLGNLTNLTILTLGLNDLGGPVPPELGNLTSLATFNLFGNQLEGVVPLGVAQVGASASDICTFANNSTLCIPDTPDYQAIGVDPICGLALDESCSVSLPVELASFEASMANEVGRQLLAVELTWQTLSETDNAGFEVERALTGSSFEALAFIEGSGTTSAPRSYRFTDSDVPFEAAGLAYRLRQIDFDGAVAHSPVVEVDLTLPVGLVLQGNFPNPFSATTTLRYELPAPTHVHLVVFDVVGREVAVLVDGLQQSGRKAVSFDASALPDGVYFYRLTSAQGVRLAGRMVRTR